MVVGIRFIIHWRFRGFRRLLMGSVAEEVIRVGRWPVLSVRKGPQALVATANYGRILAPVDFSVNTERGLVIAADLARRFSAQLDLVHVIDIPVLPEFYGPVMAPSMLGIVVTPLPSQGLSNRPIVLHPDSELTLTVTDAAGITTLVIDGQGFFPLEPGSSVRIRRHPESYPILAMADLDPYRRLRERLGWSAGLPGERNAGPPPPVDWSRDSGGPY